MPGGLTSHCGRSRLTGFWEGCERRSATAKVAGALCAVVVSPRPLSLSPRHVFLCLALPFPVSFLPCVARFAIPRGWRCSRVSLSSRGVGRIFRGFSPDVECFGVDIFAWRARVLRLAPAVVSIEVCGSHGLFWLRGLPCLFGRGQFWKRWLMSMLKRPGGML